MIKLIALAPALSLRSPSLYCLKTEALLRMAGIEYEIEVGRPDKQPKQKVPVLHEGDTCVPDSTFIQKYIEEHHAADFDSHLTDAQRAEAHAFRIMLEDRFAVIDVVARWGKNAPLIRDTAFADVPKFIRQMVFNKVFKNIKKNAHGHGVGRHSDAQQMELGLDDLRALEVRLGITGPFFFGKKPSSVDAVVYATLHGLVRGPFTNSLADFAKKSPVLKEREAALDAFFFEECAREISDRPRLHAAG